MRPWVAGLGGAALLAALAAGHLLFETTTTSSVTSSALTHGCGRHGAWPDPLAEPIDEMSYTRAVRDGERVEVTVPAGPHVMRIDGDGTALFPIPARAHPPSGPDRCPAEPFVQRYRADGEGSITVTYFLYA